MSRFRLGFRRGKEMVTAERNNSHVDAADHSWQRAQLVAAGSEVSDGALPVIHGVVHLLL